MSLSSFKAKEINGVIPWFYWNLQKIFSHFIYTLLCTKLRYLIIHVLCILLLCPCTSMVLKKVKYLIPYFFTMMYIFLTFLYYNCSSSHYGGLTVNSAIFSLVLQQGSSTPSLSEPLEITFKLTDIAQNRNPQCVYLNTTAGYVGAIKSSRFGRSIEIPNSQTNIVIESPDSR